MEQPHFGIGLFAALDRVPLDEVSGRTVFQLAQHRIGQER
jgi:hypothetical protein